MSGTTLIFNDEPLWIAMPMWGSGMGYPIGIYQTREEAMAVQEGARSKTALPMKLGVNHKVEGYLPFEGNRFNER